MNDYFCFSLSTAYWDSFIIIVIGIVLSWIACKYFSLLILFIMPVFIYCSLLTHEFRLEYNKYKLIEEGLTHKLGKECVVENLIGSEDNDSLMAFVRIDDSFQEFQVKSVPMHWCQEYVVYTTPTKVMNFKWCVDKRIGSRDKLVKVIRENDSYTGNIACDRFQAFDKRVLALPVDSCQTAVSFRNGFQSMVVMMSDRDADLLIQSVRKEEFERPFIERFFFSPRQQKDVI